MGSFLYSISKNDFVHGLVMAVLAAVLTTVYDLLLKGGAFDWKSIGLVGLTAGLSYIIKKFFSDSDGKIVVGSRKF